MASAIIILTAIALLSVSFISGNLDLEMILFCIFFAMVAIVNAIWELRRAIE